MARKELLHKLLDSPSVWCLRILAAVGIIATCVLALTRSPRVVWMALTTVLIILLSGVNHLRIRSKVKHLKGAVIRHKRNGTSSGQQ